MVAEKGSGELPIPFSFSFPQFLGKLLIAGGFLNDLIHIRRPRTLYPPLNLKHSIFYLCTIVVRGYTSLAYSWFVQHTSFLRPCLLIILTTAATYKLQNLLANHMGPVQCDITPLVINSLGGGHTHTHIHR